MFIPLQLEKSSDWEQVLNTQGCTLPHKFELVPGRGPDRGRELPAYVRIDQSLPRGVVRLITTRDHELLHEFYSDGIRPVVVPLMGVRRVLPEGTTLMLIIDDTCPRPAIDHFDRRLSA